MFLFLLLSVVSSMVRYDGHQVWRLHLEKDNPQHTQLWTKLQSLPHTLASPWKGWDLQLAPAVQETTRALLHEAGIGFNVTVKDLQIDIEREREANLLGGDWDESYHKFDEIMAWLDDLEKQYADVLVLETIGVSYEGRPLKLAKVSTGGDRSKPVIWYQSAIHAREWIAPAVMQYVLGQVLQATADPNYNPDVLAALASFDLHFLLVVNPDGYQFTFDGDRLWRKTRSPNNQSPCIGTDGNRNWDNHWGGQGSSGTPCSDTYRGASPFSEACTRAIAQHMTATVESGRSYVMAVDVHSYGQYYMSPWGWTRDDTDVHEEQMAFMTVAQSAIRSVHGLNYTIGPSAQVLYPAAGGSDDWFFGEYPSEGLGVKWSFVAELRNQNTFILPPENIIPNGEEFLASVLSGAAFIAART